MIALMARNHRNCLRMLYHKTRQTAIKDEQEKNAQLHGKAFAELLNPGATKTFQDYAENVFVLYTKSQLKKANQLDIIWDFYLPDSLKGTTRERRGRRNKKKKLVTHHNTAKALARLPTC